MKPKLNLNWYRNKDYYSEGNVEDQILEIIKNEQPEQYSEAIYHHFSWPVFYHLSHLRQNILNWYPFQKESSVLEIGCGMGAITSLLCKSCRKVTAVELSKRRAKATALRCRDYNNLEIIVGNLNDIVFEETFDYITLIGVLEYQSKYSEGENPFRDFLVSLRYLLKPGGKILIAIENKYGLKYWCGSPEDHSGIPFDSINQYQFNQNGAITFSKQGLASLLENSNLPHYRFYFPLPDYKLPQMICTEEYKPGLEEFAQFRPYYNHSQSLIAREENLYDDLLQNHVFDFFSNSFFVECSADNHVFTDINFVLSSTLRMPEYRINTKIAKDGFVWKQAFSEEGYHHLKSSIHYLDELDKRGILTAPHGLGKGMECYSRYLSFPSLQMLILTSVKCGNTSEAIGYLEKLWAEIERSSDQVPDSQNALIELGFASPSGVYGSVLKKAYLDMIPRNCFWDGEHLVFIDQEWVMENIPVNLVKYRALNELYLKNPWLDKRLPLSQLALRFGLVNGWEAYKKFQIYFSTNVMDQYHNASLNQLQKIDPKTCISNIKKLIGTGEAAKDTSIEQVKQKLYAMFQEGKPDQAYEFFAKIAPQENEDREFIVIRKLLEIYGFERSEKQESFMGFSKELQELEIHYHTIRMMLRRVLEQGTNEVLEEASCYFYNQKVSYCAYLTILEFEFDEREKITILERMLDILQRVKGEAYRKPVLAYLNSLKESTLNE